MPAEQARGVQTTWLYTLGSIVFFFGFLDVIVALTMLETYLSTDDPVTAAAIVLLFVASAIQLRYCWFLRSGRGGGLPRPAWTIALFASAGAVWVLGLIPPGNELAAAVPLWAATCLAACLLPTTRRWLSLLAGALVLIAHPVLAVMTTGASDIHVRASAAWMLGIYCLLLPFMVITSMWFWEVIVELDRHRRAAAELAVTQERLRFASDLHDIQGHHLQVISLKSELAERLLLIDPEAARVHLHETRLIAKQALEETRSLVAGYRQVAFDDELENAREVLTAAGAECELRLGAVPTDAAAQSLLASVVREATTNILRHSEATRVTIELTTTGDRTELAIANDGVPVTDAPAPGPTGTSERAAGSGLAGLRERLATLGGTLETAADASTGPSRRGGRFEVRATVVLP
ncbi:sensor histidine kinase [Agromyces laixinhei]|uniref:sensor histidine kinase n=1 Tax=Agromyces laixinhei TaxID=2585717 RepID=UPI0012EDB65E|nr:histidine kinase [Agromyces laixinhei]